MLSCTLLNGAVLQRNQGNRIEGFGKEGSSIRVCFQDQEYEARVQNGKWRVETEPLQAGGPFEMKISSKEETLRLTLWVGDVYLLGGQSNMEFRLKDEKHHKEAHALKNARLLTIPQVEYEQDGKAFPSFPALVWKEATKDNLMEFSAIGYYIGTVLDGLDIPIGLVSCNKGGTSASCWIDQKTLFSNARLKKAYWDGYWRGIENQTEEQEDRARANYQKELDAYQKKLARYQLDHPEASLSDVKKAVGHTPWPGPKGNKDFGRPCGLIDTMFSKVETMAFAGIVWYQGEEDTKYGELYEPLLMALVSLWRTRLGGNIPFSIVQLPKYRDDKNEKWPLVRDAQKRVCEKLPDCALIVSVDTGEEFNIHPTDKSVLGKRIGQKILDPAQGAKIVSFRDGIVTFDREIVVKQNRLGWLPVSDREVKVPEHVKEYAFDNYPEVFLFEKDGTPVAPFRLDEA